MASRINPMQYMLEFSSNYCFSSVMQQLFSLVNLEYLWTYVHKMKQISSAFVHDYWKKRCCSQQQKMNMEVYVRIYIN